MGKKSPAQQNVTSNTTTTTNNNNSAIFIISTVLDKATNRAARPLSEFFVVPAAPIREAWLYRFLVNLVWFARNYLNIVCIAALVGAVLQPFFVLCVICAVKIHFDRQKRIEAELKERQRTQEQRRSAAAQFSTDSLHDSGGGNRQDGEQPSSPPTVTTPNTLIVTGAPISSPSCRFWKIAQLVSCVFVAWYYGLFLGIVISTIATMVICLHAILTPYTDESSKYYDSLFEKNKEDILGIQEDGIRTPVIDYELDGAELITSSANRSPARSHTGGSTTPRLTPRGGTPIIPQNYPTHVNNINRVSSIADLSAVAPPALNLNDNVHETPSPSHRQTVLQSHQEEEDSWQFQHSEHLMDASSSGGSHNHSFSEGFQMTMIESFRRTPHGKAPSKDSFSQQRGLPQQQQTTGVSGSGLRHRSTAATAVATTAPESCDV